MRLSYGVIVRINILRAIWLLLVDLPTMTMSTLCSFDALASFVQSGVLSTRDICWTELLVRLSRTKSWCSSRSSCFLSRGAKL